MRSLAVVLTTVNLWVTVGVASVLTPPVLPLIVRNPYLSTWLGNARHEPWSGWPIFWTGEEIGLSLMAQVPSTNSVYALLGKPHDSLSSDAGYHIKNPAYLGSHFDASVTNLTYRIDTPSSDSVDITVSFLSPITPTSTMRQSIPASYVTVHVHGGVDVNIYMDLNGRWVSSDMNSQITWNHDVVKSDNNGTVPLQRWQIQRQTELLYSEIADRGEWGTLHFTGPADATYQSGEATAVRRAFAAKGAVGNTNDDGFRSIGDREPVFSFSKSFSSKTTQGSGSSVTFTVAHVQDTVIQFASGRGLTYMRPLWKSWHTTVEDLLKFHYQDFEAASLLAANYSDQLAKDAYVSGADDYVDIVALSARQVLGATTFTGTQDDPSLFMKEISSDGNTQTIDVIYPSFPFFMYTNPRWLAYLLEPLMEHMLSGQYPNKYAMHDLGAHFPNATGHPDGNDERMPLEECGNILVMGLALVNSLRYSNDSTASSIFSTQGVAAGVSSNNQGFFPLDGMQKLDGIGMLDAKWGGGSEGEELAEKWVQRTYKLWAQWTTYLIKYALMPEDQLSTDDFAGSLPLQTSLALKGILGINAMSKLAEVVGKESDVAYYKNISDTYIAKWEEYGMSRDKTHIKLAYNWEGSWTNLYNVYSDAQLCFHLDGTDISPEPAYSIYDSFQPSKPEKKYGFVPRHIYRKQSTWYHYVRQKYGLPLDSRHLYAKSDWEFFAMAVASKDTRSEILESLAKWVNETATDRPLTDLHNTEGDGGYPDAAFKARPVVGGHFAFLALERACGGRAMEGLKFLDDPKDLKAEEMAALAAEEFMSTGWHHGSEGGEL